MSASGSVMTHAGTLAREQHGNAVSNARGVGAFNARSRSNSRNHRPGVLIEPSRQRLPHARQSLQRATDPAVPSRSANASATSSASRSGAYCGCVSSARSRSPRAICAFTRASANAAEAGEQLQFEKLRVVQPEHRGRVAQRRRLRLAADAADAGADIDRRLLAGMEQPGIEHKLAVGDRNQIGRDIGAEIAGIGLGNRQRGQRPAAALRRQLRRALQQPRMQVEHVARIGLASRRLARQQRDLAMRRGVLGQVVDHHQRVAARGRENTRPWSCRRTARSIAARARPPRRRRRRCSAPARHAGAPHRSPARWWRISAPPRHRCRSCRWISD